MVAEKRLCLWLAEMADQGHILAAHDLSEGGFAVALAEMALVGGVGITAEVPVKALGNAVRSDAALFGEFPGRVLIALLDEAAETVTRSAEEAGLRFAPIGRSSGTKRLVIESSRIPLVDLALEACVEAYEGALSEA